MNKERTLVAYFSATGVTRRAAMSLAKAAGGVNICEIKPEIPYTPVDLDWTDIKSRSTVEMHDLSYRPKMQSINLDMSTYDVVFLGFPIWWHMAPTIINTFLESFDFGGKTIILFATSGGSGMDNSMKGLKVSVPGTTIFKGEKVIRNAGQEELTEWIKSLEV